MVQVGHPPHLTEFGKSNGGNIDVPAFDIIADITVPDNHLAMAPPHI